MSCSRCTAADPDPELLGLVDGAPITLVFGNGTSIAVAIAAGSFDDTARSRFDLIAFIDDLGNVIVMAEEVGRDSVGLDLLAWLLLFC